MVPECLKRDSLWSFQVYPKALFLSDLAWEDCGAMMKDPRGRAIAEQMIRSAGSIPANLEEGFGRGFGKDNAYFQRIALGSARETRGWYYRGRRLLTEEVLKHRLALVSEIIAILVPATAYQRNRKP
jgi:four helix bundle protein